jgi:hypothetical protein
MPAGERIKFACGEFLPGKETIVLPGIQPPAPPILIPKPHPCCTEPPGKKPVDEEWVCICTATCTDNYPNSCQNNASRKCVQLTNLPPGQVHGADVYPTKAACEGDAFGKPPCWICGVRCDVYDPLPCPPPFTNIIKFIKKECVICQPKANQDAKCLYKTVSECRNNCVSVNNNCPDEPGRGNVTPITPKNPDPPSRPVTPVTPIGPITPEDRYRCVETKIYCPDERTLKQIIRNCVYCGPSNDPNLPKDCTLNQQACRVSCKSTIEMPCPGPITPDRGETGDPGKRIEVVNRIDNGTITPPNNPGVIINPNARRNEVINNSEQNNFGATGKWRILDGICKQCTQFEISNFGVNCPYNSEFACLEVKKAELTNSYVIKEKTDNTTVVTLKNLDSMQAGMIVAPQGDISQLIPPYNPLGLISKPTVIDIDAYASGLNISQSKVSRETLYSEKFNFFKYRPTEEFQVVENSKYLNIFKNAVAKEVAYILNKNGTTASWSEYPYTQLTKAKLTYSIRTDLLSIFNSLIYQTGQPILIDYFLQTILNLLFTNRLDEFDFDIFKELAQRQAADERIIFKRSENQAIQEKAALGIISNEAQYYDPNKQEGPQRLQLLRSRALNEDIEAVIPIERFATLAVVEPLPLPNDGLEVEVYNEGAPTDVGVVPLGDGDGYYISATTVQYGTLPLYLSSQLSSTFYLPQSTRLKVLDLFNIDPTIVLSTSSTYTNSEFGAGYDLTSTLFPLYFALNLSSIGDLERVNSLVDEVSALFVLQTSANANAHAQNYGLNAVRVNVDFNDPFFVYAKNASSINLRMSDISFRSMIPARSNNNQILARSIPFALILVPGMGSEHNPFATISKLSNFENTVIRDLELVPTIFKSKSEQDILALDEKYLYDELGTFKLGIGGVVDTQNVIYRFNPNSDRYGLSYFSGGVYTSTQPARDRLPHGKLVYDIIESTIKTNYSLQSDVYGTSSVTWWDLFRRLTATEYASLGVYVTDKFFNKLALGWRGINVRDVLNRQVEGESGIIEDAVASDDTIYINSEDRENAKSY